jgi:esterase/lipase
MDNRLLSVTYLTIDPAGHLPGVRAGRRGGTPVPGPTANAPDVMPGAEPFAFAGSGSDARTGVLLIHGFTGTPMSMRPWGEHLAQEGFTVRCPLLPGHGTRWQDANLASSDQWTTAVGEAFDTLAAECDQVFVAGLSLGGTLAIRFAETRPTDLAGLLLVNPALLTQRLDAKFLPLIARLTGSWAPIASDIKKPGVVELAYPKLPTRAMMQVRTLWAATRADLPKVITPVIVFHSTEDHVVEPVNTQVLLDGVSSSDTTEVVLRDSYHVATLDNDAPLIFTGSVDWIRDRAARPEVPPAGSSAAETR